MSLEEAAAAIRAGQVVGIPTDTVYGIGCDPFNRRAVSRLYRLKGRPGGKPVGLLVASATQALEVITVPPYAREWMKAHWPGPLTLVALPLIAFPAWIGDPATRAVGVRVPDHPATIALLNLTGPLAVTSANRSGEAETLDDREAEAIFGRAVAQYLPGRCPGAVASTVVDVTGDGPMVLRKGPLSLE
jgi:tRNA threonylcarbamoyl adenosine modification protein (Sua5/YciO/YrdC/YwlC family)